MTTDRNPPYPNDGPSTYNHAAATAAASAIARVDSVALALYRRARTSGPEFDEVAAEARSLHTALKHLRLEAEDKDSVLARDTASLDPDSVSARRLARLVEDCDFTLKEVDTLLDRYGNAGSGGEGAKEQRHRAALPVESDSRKRDMIARVRDKVAVCKMDIDVFLDTVQLHTTTQAKQNLEQADGQQLDSIKDKVDAIALRLFNKRSATDYPGDDEELWVQFRTELEREGFSKEVLRNNQEVLRGYIRELDTHGYLQGDQPVSVRGLLDQQPHGAPAMNIVPASYPGPSHDTSLAPYPTDSPRSSQELQSRSYQPALLHPYGSSGLSYERYDSSSSDDGYIDSPSDLTLISTRDLMSMDRREADVLATRMQSMHLAPQNQLPAPNYSVSPGTSPTNRFLPAPVGASQPIPIATGQRPALLPPDHQLSSSPGSQQLMGMSPRYMPPALVPGSYQPPQSSALSPSLFPGSAPQPGAFPASPTISNSSTLVAAPARHARLAPDSAGREIPLDATWTSIKRSLISLEVLDRAGVRYEARPQFVAILGHLSREQVADFARQSELVRRARRHNVAHKRRDRGENRTRDVGHERTSHKRIDSDSESEPLWDESDTTDVEDLKSRQKNRRRGSSVGDASATKSVASSSARDKYTPKTYIETASSTNHNGDRSVNYDSAEDKGTRIYPVIVPAPSMSGANGAAADGKLSPSAAVPPKSILKNKNENHVRFDANGPHEVSEAEISREKEKRDRKRRDKDRDRDRNREPTRKDKDRASKRYHSSNGGGSRSRGGDEWIPEGMSREEYRRREKAGKKRAWGETLGAVGIGGAAASLLSVLTEAAAGGF